MIYQLNISVETSRNAVVALHAPVIIETITPSKQGITEDELNMVTEAFQQQLRELIYVVSDNSFKEI